MTKLSKNKYFNFDRATHLREIKDINNLKLSKKKIKLLEVWDEKFYVNQFKKNTVEIKWIEDRKAIEQIMHDGSSIFIGIINNTYYFARSMKAKKNLSKNFFDLRTLNPLLKKSDLSILTTTKGLLYWHKNNKFCSTCGSPSLIKDLGHSIECSKTVCKKKIFPRIDPAVIMLITYEDSCLLGRQSIWPKGMHSTLAGFVEHGETLEQAVQRETKEEAGIKTKNIKYKYSQPWPFPSSIMLGYRAEALSKNLKINFNELETANWFTKKYLKSLNKNDSFRLPGKISIARRLIEEWLYEN